MPRTSTDSSSQDSYWSGKEASFRRFLELQLKATNLEPPTSSSNKGLFQGLLRGRKPLNPMYRLSAFRPTTACVQQQRQGDDNSSSSSGKDTTITSNSESPFQVVFESEVIRNNRNPQWAKHSIRMEELLSSGSLFGGMDTLSPILISVFDVEITNDAEVENESKETLLGECETTVFDLNNFIGVDNNDLDGVDAFSKSCFTIKDKSGKVTGSLIPLDASIYEEPVPPPLLLPGRDRPVQVQEVSIIQKTMHQKSTDNNCSPHHHRNREDDDTTISSTTVSTLIESLQQSFHESLSSETSRLRQENEQLKARVQNLETRVREYDAAAGMAITLAANLDKVQKELTFLKEKYKALTKSRHELSSCRSRRNSGHHVSRHRRSSGSHRHDEESHKESPSSIGHSSTDSKTPSTKEEMSGSRSRDRQRRRRTHQYERDHCQG